MQVRILLGLQLIYFGLTTDRWGVVGLRISPLLVFNRSFSVEAPKQIVSHDTRKPVGRVGKPQASLFSFHLQTQKFYMLYKLEVPYHADYRRKLNEKPVIVDCLLKGRPIIGTQSNLKWLRKRLLAVHQNLPNIPIEPGDDLTSAFKFVNSKGRELAWTIVGKPDVFVGYWDFDIQLPIRTKILEW